ncbi:LLM class flavin-dependent oxidoreductase [Nocardia sp. NBC_00565]|uniref:LLM class flavin-dependent oxidoreductase n=1 Tax=Nocardia sp. NBC_00565 TaxID=2975993 RepID=UPI002E80382F|nr:LLM class flavin-dependent oxidoreductase [Nocardia sp. NBC_00565]WUC05724.1 LLM class flavin-dependent oxidoreductase [Nocardia sp. NBC_00565]
MPEIPAVPQFGVFVPQINTTAAAVIATAQAAEQSGFDSFWVMDHLYAPGAPPLDVPESWILLTAIAAATSTIRLGHLVGANPFRHPSVLAKMAATLDQISGGRLDLGLGWGSVEDEFAMFGIEAGTRRERSERLAETIEILELMFTGRRFDYAGKHFRLRGAWGLPVPPQGRIPIHIGGGGRMLTMPLVAEHADWWNCVAAARGRMPELAPLRGTARISAQYPVGLVHPGEDPAEVRTKLLRRMPESSWGTPLIGTPDQLVEQLLVEWSRGVELFIIRFHDHAPPRTLELFGAKIAAPLRTIADPSSTTGGEAASAEPQPRPENQNP